MLKTGDGPAYNKEGMTDGTTTALPTCDNCGETLAAGEKTCPYCGAAVSARRPHREPTPKRQPRPLRPAPQPREGAPETASGEKRARAAGVPAPKRLSLPRGGFRLGYEYVMLAVPLILAAYAVFMLAPLHPFQRPLVRLVLAAVAMALASATLAVVDSERIKLGNSGGRTLGPLQWFAGILLFWPVVFPYYFRARGAHTRPRLFKPAVAVTAVCVIAMVVSVALIRENYDRLWSGERRTGSGSVLELPLPR
jgi:hypothetical protein